MFIDQRTSEAYIEQVEEPVVLEVIRLASAAVVLFGLLIAGPVFA